MNPLNAKPRWEPVLMPGAVAAHWASCPDCPHTIEWSVVTPDEPWIGTDAPHLVFGKVMPSEPLNLPGVLSAGIVDDDGNVLYSCWVPEAAAIRFRDLMLAWWPLDRFPKGDV